MTGWFGPIHDRSTFLATGDTYAGDLGGINGNPSLLVMDNLSAARVTVEGIGYTAPADLQAVHTADFGILGIDWLDVSAGNNNHSGQNGPGIARIALAPDANLGGSFTTANDGIVVVNALAPGAQLGDWSGNMQGGTAVMFGPITGQSQITMSNSGPGESSTLEINGPVGHAGAPGEAIDINAGNLRLDQPMAFHGSVIWDPGGQAQSSVIYEGVHADSYQEIGNTLHLFAGSADVLQTAVIITGVGQQRFHVSDTPAGAMVSSQDPQFLAGAIAIPLHIG